MPARSRSSPRPTAWLRRIPPNRGRDYPAHFRDCVCPADSSAPNGRRISSRGSRQHAGLGAVYEEPADKGDQDDDQQRVAPRCQTEGGQGDKGEDKADLQYPVGVDLVHQPTDENGCNDIPQHDRGETEAILYYRGPTLAQ